MTFVTDDAVDAAVYAFHAVYDGPGGERRAMRSALEAVSALWLAHLRDASEHLADYTTAAKAAVKLKEIAP